MYAHESLQLPLSKTAHIVLLLSKSLGDSLLRPTPHGVQDS